MRIDYMTFIEYIKRLLGKNPAKCKMADDGKHLYKTMPKGFGDDFYIELTCNLCGYKKEIK